MNKNRVAHMGILTVEADFGQTSHVVNLTFAEITIISFYWVSIVDHCRPLYIMNMN